MLAQGAKGNLAMCDYKNILCKVKHGSFDYQKSFVLTSLLKLKRINNLTRLEWRCEDLCVASKIATLCRVSDFILVARMWAECHYSLLC